MDPVGKAEKAEVEHVENAFTNPPADLLEKASLGEVDVGVQALDGQDLNFTAEGWPYFSQQNLEMLKKRRE